MTTPPEPPPSDIHPGALASFLAVRNTAPPVKRTALLVEMVSGLLLIPGVGWMYAGNPLRGGVILVFALLGTLPIVIQFAGASLGLGLCCCLPPLYAGVAFDVFALNKWIDNPTPYTWRNVAIELVVSSLLLFILIAIDIFLLVYLIKLIMDAISIP